MGHGKRWALWKTLSVKAFCGKRMWQGSWLEREDWSFKNGFGEEMKVGRTNCPWPWTSREDYPAKAKCRSQDGSPLLSWWCFRAEVCRKKEKSTSELPWSLRLLAAQGTQPSPHHQEGWVVHRLGWTVHWLMVHDW